MRNSAFLSSHPTGLPAGMTPVIVDQSPEMSSRTVFEGHNYHEELDLKSEFLPKSAASLSNYSMSDIPLRARDAAHELGSLQYNQGGYSVNALSTTTFDSSRSQSQGTYPDGLTSSRPSTSDDGEYPPLLAGYQVKIIEWGPQQGSVGASVQATIVSPFKIDACRTLSACFGRQQTGTVCTLLGDGLPPFRYIISFQATAQAAPQWPTKANKMCASLSLYIPFEGYSQEVTIDLGPFTYSDGGVPPARPDSGLGRKRRTSSTGYDPRSPPSTLSQDSDYSSAAHRIKSRFGQLPPLRSGISTAGSSLQASSYGSSTLQDEYQNQQAEAVSPFYQSVLPPYSYPAACTPPTPSWTTSSSSSTVMTLGSSANTVPLTNDTSAVRGHNPRFVRRRNDQIASISAPGTKTPAAPAFNPYGMYPNHKAVLELEGDLDSMTRDWTPREKQDKRRLVHFSRVQQGSAIHASFRPVDPDQKEPNLTMISCIWREDRKECYVTSVDTISLLESLVTPDTAFTVEEKNRIRRNLEGFHPETISKQKPQNEEFFKQIMGYPPPRPRHIEKDVKVFKWSTLVVALKKIISKYCASYASTADVPRRNTTESHYGDGTTSLQSQDFSASQHRAGLTASTPYPMVPSNGHGQQLSFGATANSFGDYTHSYGHYASTLASRYPHYNGQAQCGGVTTDGNPATNQVLLQHQQSQHPSQHQSQQHQQQQSQQQQQHQHQQSRQAVGFGGEWAGHYV